MARMTDRVCIVTGGAVGLGRVYCQALAKEGAKVAVLDIADGSELAEEIGGIYLKADVSNVSDVEAAVATIRERFGKIDVLINNAAIFSKLPLVRYDEIDPDLWDQVMAVNTKGAFLMIRAVGPVMEAQRSGKIINITSGTTYKGMPNLLHYVSSKGALVAMTRCLSRELGDHGICINNLSPGLILSDSIAANKEHVDGLSDRVLASRALKRHGYPDDLIGALLFLSSGESDFVTGQTIAVDGGSVNT